MRARDDRRTQVLLAVTAVGLAAACGGKERPQPGGVVRIEAGYPGADAHELEQLVLAPLEHAVSGLPDVVAVRGEVSRDTASVEVRFARGVGRDQANLAVVHAIQGSLGRLPDGVTSPMIAAGRPATWVYATAPQAVAARLRHEVLRVPGVMRAETCGDRRPTVAVELDVDRLRARGLSADQVVAAIERANVDVPAGRVTAGGSSLTVRTHGPMSSLADVEAIVVDDHGTRVSDLAVIRLDDVPDCRVTGAGVDGDVLLRVGLRGDVDDREQARRALASRLTAAGATLLPRPITFGVAETELPLDLLPEAVREWTTSVDGVLALTNRSSQRIVLLWPGHDPTAADTARTLTAPAPGPRHSLARWTLVASPLVEATLVGDDLDELRRQALAAVAALDASPDVAASGCPACRRTPELRVELDRDAMARHGVPVVDVTRALRLLRPRQVSSLIDGSSIVDVTVAVAVDDDRPDSWLDLPLADAGGGRLLLRDVARLEQELSPGAIVHVDGRRAVTVWAQGRPGVPAARVRRALAAALPGATLAAADLRELEAESWRAP